jgi:energy-coupling factor transport system ATP-binding protein
VSPIEVEDLRFRYEGRKTDVLSGVNLRIEDGETVLLLGPSGSGKSTLALCLSGLIPHAVAGEMEGKVTIDGLDTASVPVADLTRKVGAVFQDPEAQLVAMRVEDEVAFGPENLCVREEELDRRVDEALQRVGMGGMRCLPVDDLSGGYKQRLALASVLALKPKTLVLDEPTANLDPTGTREFFGTLENLKRAGGLTVVLIEHKLDHLVDLLDRVVVLVRGGALLTQGPPREVFRVHVGELLRHGVWTPQVALLAHRLDERGVRLYPFPTTLDEAETALANIPHPPSRPAQPGISEPKPADRGDTPALEVGGLSFSYGGVRILDEVSFAVPRGDFLAIVGANGAGKSTLLRHLVGLARLRRGSVLLRGRDVSLLPAREVFREVGFVFQNPEHQFVTDSVYEEVAFGLRSLGLPEDEVRGRAEAALDRFGLLPHAKANPFALSGGEKRRLSVATMLVAGQEVLVLDEPTFGQDHENAAELMSLLRELNAQGRTVVVVTHDMTLVAEHSKSVAVLSRGALLYHGPARPAFDSPRLLEEARLDLPPLADLSRRLAVRDPNWVGLLSVEDFERTCAPDVPRCSGEGTPRA